MKVRKAQIDDFFAGKHIAIAGVSRNPKKFGHEVFKELLKNGYDILPINPNAEKINGHHCYASVETLPADVDSLLIVTPKFETDQVLRSALNKGIKNIWVQQMSHTDSTLKIAEEFEKEIIHNKCIFMFAEPVKGAHKIHRVIMKLFGQLPG
ncbi:MAG: CoA-binding protein [Bacteroidota bacterium]|nr:MAG: CoA-binding protein [Bacteroidota bacterium]